MQNQLEKLGFDPKEATLYLALLELGEAGIVEISRKSGLKRTTVYHILDDLKSRGLVSQNQKGKKVRYMAEDPHSIGQSLKEKEALFEKTLPELLSIANMFEKKPAIRYFEGLNGIKEVYNDELKHESSELLCWWAESYAIFGDEFFYDYYVPERLKKKIWVRSIMPRNDAMAKYDANNEKELRQVRVADLEPTFAELEISLYGKSKVSIKSFQEKFALIIESRALFNTLKNIFELQWKSLG
ncbi:MAG: hypothetical protein A2288_00785 [Candidatus Moranbacteria bacterium RIFOXYA12_FULL_44_15]|nr:MAG: hypothetical protein A2288_00785 [Candidatus Moranbacteria bacterium RIFOXYA12_FULL_44_15]OGI35063.1 MAG: hypothetical protein A2259_04800 [Candidatus Moranbacteria bacterium RIFOXYA2_FULL_43_15]